VRDSRSPDDPLTIPARTPVPSRPTFPVLASIAPVGVAVAIWAVTQSPLSLVFAGFAPVVALASLLDSKRLARRASRRAESDWQAAAAALRVLIAERHSAERSERARLFPSSGAVVEARPGDLSRWKAGGDARGILTLGIGEVPSSLRLHGTADSSEARALRAQALTLREAAVCVQARGGIGVLGPPALARAVVRGYLLQLAHTLPPGDAVIASLPPNGWDWAERLPLSAESAPRRDGRLALVVKEQFDPDGRSAPRQNGPDAIEITLAKTAERLPPGCATVLEVLGPRSARVLSCAEVGGTETVRPECISLATAGRVAGALAELARSAGVVHSHATVPTCVEFATLEQPRRSGRDSLACAIGRDHEGTTVLDLVSHGPHAVIGGTTGSGKSELLISWLAGIASGRTPAEVCFLLVDFKGGATFQSLSRLSHCVGVITDLDDREARRALDSLRAELRRRERALAASGVRDISELPAGATLPRLVVAVDEFATMVTSFADLHAVFVDIAARGRSLGVHLILCTQRPAGVMREALMANCGLRLSLRVNNPSDSSAVVASDAAARLPADRPGMAILLASGSEATIQVATTTQADLDVIAASVSALQPARRPWLDPLAPTIPLATLPLSADCFVLGVEDRPAEQLQSPALYDPRTQGSMIVVGMQGSGKSQLVEILHSQSRTGYEVVVVPPDIEGAWDSVNELVTCCSRAPSDQPPRGDDRLLVLIDDVDSLLARLSAEYQAPFSDRLSTLLRDGAAHGIHLVVTTQRVTGPIHALVPMFGETLLLRMPSRQEHLLAGGDPELYAEQTRPGAGQLRGNLIQLATCEARVRPVRAARGLARSRAAHPPLDLAPGRSYALVTPTPAMRSAQLNAVGTTPIRIIDLAVTPASTHRGSDELTVVNVRECVVFVGDADAWQQHWALLNAIRQRAKIVFDSCSLSEIRAITRRRELPPPLAAGSGAVWVLDELGRFSRATLPHATTDVPRIDDSGIEGSQASSASETELDSSPRADATAPLVTEPP
jgi:DNA segregation ATPase FtsK/SpoIIIE, S-DNA-T family